MVEVDKENETISLTRPEKIDDHVETIDLSEGTTSITVEISALRELRLIHSPSSHDNQNNINNINETCEEVVVAINPSSSVE